ncbi:MAG TPA: hypothetical protein VF471_02625 [Pseudoxanthomonas sp.]
MNDYYQIGKVVLVFSLIVQLIMLALQVAALHRHRHISFWLLCGSSVLGALYAGMTGAPYFVSFSEAIALKMFKAGTLCGIVGALSGVWGTAMLFRSYRSLSEIANHDNARSTQ